MAKTMQAAFVDKFGEPLKIREVPVPDPGPGEVLERYLRIGHGIVIFQPLQKGHNIMVGKLQPEAAGILLNAAGSGVQGG
jgi:Zn-dependent alcohol dehydrogenase